MVYEHTPFGERKIREDYGVAAEPGPDSTHNVAEYTALIKGIEWIRENLEGRKLEILGDSQLVIRHLTGEYRVSSPRMKPLYEKACSALAGFEWNANWIPREQNAIADELSERAYREYYVKNFGTVPPTMRQRGAIE